MPLDSRSVGECCYNQTICTFRRIWAQENKTSSTRYLGIKKNLHQHVAFGIKNKQHFAFGQPIRGGVLPDPETYLGPPKNARSVSTTYRMRRANATKNTCLMTNDVDCNVCVVVTCDGDVWRCGEVFFFGCVSRSSGNCCSLCHFRVQAYHRRLLPAACCLLPAARCPLPAACCLLHCHSPHPLY